MPTSVLWLLLLCLVVDPLIARLRGGCDTYSRLCNNICLLAVGKFPNMVSGLMQWAHHTVETWYEVGLLVNPDKTEFVVFTRRRKLPGFSEPHFFGVTLSRSRSVKYLS
jgi:hypothetical protein